MTRYEQWRANPSSLQWTAPAPNPNPQPSVAHRSINSHGTNTPTSSSTPSSSRSRTSIPPRSRVPSPYDQSSPEDDRPRREREEVYPADGARAEQRQARGDDVRRHREWEEDGRRQMNRQEQDGILHRQREAEHAAQAARLGPPPGQNHGVTIAPVGPVQYPGASASGSSGLIAGYLQMPLESPTRCVTSLEHMHSWYLKNLDTDLVQKDLIQREALILSLAILD